MAKLIWLTTRRYKDRSGGKPVLVNVELVTSIIREEEMGYTSIAFGPDQDIWVAETLEQIEALMSARLWPCPECGKPVILGEQCADCGTQTVKPA